MSQSNLGIMGFGRAGNNLYHALKGIDSSTCPTFRKVSTRDLEANLRLQKVYSEGYFPEVCDYSDSIADFCRDLEWMIISTPAGFHWGQLSEALRCNPDLRIMVEKPVFTCQDRDSIILEKDFGRVRVANQLSFHPCFQTFRKAIMGNSSTIVRATLNMFKNSPIEPGTMRADSKLSGGGALMDIGPHALDMIDRIPCFWPTCMEKYPHFTFMPGQKAELMDLEAYFVLDAGSGIDVSIGLSCIKQGLDQQSFENIFEVVYSTGDRLTLDFSTMNWKINGVPTKPCNPRQLMLEDWFRGGENCTKLTSAIEHMRIIHEAYWMAA